MQEVASQFDESVAPSERSGTLQRGLAILATLTDAARELSLAEIAALVGLDQSTALRIVKVLEEAGYVVRDAASRRYAPSPKTLFPLPLLHPLEQLRRESRPILNDLARELGMTVILALFRGTERMVLDIARVPDAVAPYYGTWLKGPLHATGVGKALLSSVDLTERRRLLGPGPFERFTPSTIVDAATLESEIEQSIREGYVASRGEHRPGITNVARVLRSWSGAVAGCINISAHEARMDNEACRTCGEALCRASDQLVYQAPSLEAASRYLHA